MSSMKLLNQSKKIHTANLNHTPIQSNLMYVYQAFTLAKCYYKYTMFFVNNYMTIAQYSIILWLLCLVFFFTIAFDLESILN